MISSHHATDNLQVSLLIMGECMESSKQNSSITCKHVQEQDKELAKQK